MQLYCPSLGMTLVKHNVTAQISSTPIEQSSLTLHSWWVWMSFQLVLPLLSTHTKLESGPTNKHGSTLLWLSSITMCQCSTGWIALLPEPGHTRTFSTISSCYLSVQVLRDIPYRFLHPICSVTTPFQDQVWNLSKLKLWSSPYLSINVPFFLTKRCRITPVGKTMYWSYRSLYNKAKIRKY